MEYILWSILNFSNSFDPKLYLLVDQILSDFLSQISSRDVVFNCWSMIEFLVSVFEMKIWRSNDDSDVFDFWRRALKILRR